MREFCTQSTPKIQPSHCRKFDHSVRRIDRLIDRLPLGMRSMNILSSEVPILKIFASANLPNLNQLSRGDFLMTPQLFSIPQLRQILCLIMPPWVLQSQVPSVQAPPHMDPLGQQQPLTKRLLFLHFLPATTSLLSLKILLQSWTCLTTIQVDPRQSN